MVMWVGGVEGTELIQSHPNDSEMTEWDKNKFEVFSKFLGFFTLGMEKEIAKFFNNLRSKREKIHSKEALENTRFERELKRLPFDVNYKKGSSSCSKVKGT